MPMVRRGFTDRRRDALLQQLGQAAGPLSIREIMQRARLHPGERTEVKRVLRDLAREGVVTHEGKRFALPRAAKAESERPARGVAPPRAGRAPSLRSQVGELEGVLVPAPDAAPGFLSDAPRPA